MKLISFILAFYVLVCAAIPCCGGDDCVGVNKTEKKSGECKGDCSPFFSCGNCCGFSVDVEQITIAPPAAGTTPHYPLSHISSIADYHPSFWQPPRLS